MADERRAHEVDVAALTITYLAEALAGTFRPANANPYRKTPARPKTPGETKVESDEGWAILRAGLGVMAGSRSGGN